MFTFSSFAVNDAAGDPPHAKVQWRSPKGKVDRQCIFMKVYRLPEGWRLHRRVCTPRTISRRLSPRDLRAPSYATIRAVARFPESSSEAPELDARPVALSVVEKLARCSKSACPGSSLRRQDNDRLTVGRNVPLGQDRPCCQEGRRPSYRVAGQPREARRKALTCQNSKR